MAHILLIGFMGAGKTTVGRLVATRMGVDFLDLDELIESADGRSVARIFSEDGEDGFRKLESDGLVRLMSAPPSVVACGGGVVMDAGNRTTLRRLGTVVFLQVGAQEALARIADTGSRPLLAGSGAALAAPLLRSREALYVATADITVSTARRAPEAVADEVVAAVGGALG